MSITPTLKLHKEGTYNYQLDTYWKIAYISGHTDGSAVVHLPSEVVVDNVKYTIVGTDMLAFHDEPSLEEIYVPDTYKSFDYGAFQNCPRLRKMHLGKMFGSNENWDQFFTRNKMGQWDVDRTSLQEVTIDPDNPYIKMSGDGLFILTSDGKEILTVVRNMEQLTIPEGIEWVGVNALCGLDKLKTLHLPETLKGIAGGSKIRVNNKREL